MPSRQFLLIQDRARTDADFSTGGVANNGRLDIGCRFLNAALFTSYSLRQDVDVHLLLRGPPNPPVHMRFRGEKISGLHPDEASIAGYIKKNLGSFQERMVPANTGVAMDRRDLGQVLDDVDAEPFLLHEDGDDIESIPVPGEPIFILGDNKGVSEDCLEAMEDRDVRTVSLGPDSYQAQQVASYLNIRLDRG